VLALLIGDSETEPCRQTCAVYGNPAQVPVTEDTLPAPISPYRWSKLMKEIIFRDTDTAHDLRYVILCHFTMPIRSAVPRSRRISPP
jgi:nucleoside-diphosphate-sugar epimerase